MRFTSFAMEQINMVCAKLLITREDLSWCSSTSQKVKDAKARKVKCRQYLLENHMSPELAAVVTDAIADELVSAYSSGMLREPTTTAADALHTMVQRMLTDDPVTLMAVDLMLQQEMRVADVKHLRLMNAYREITAQPSTVYVAVDVYRYGNYAVKKDPVTLVSPDSARQWALSVGSDELNFRLFRAFIAGNLHCLAKQHTTKIEHEQHVTSLYPLVTLPDEWNKTVVDTWQPWDTYVNDLCKRMGLDDDV